MNNESSTSELSSPFSTGGGGVTFEQLVGASYLVSLLAEDIPRGLDWGITKEVKFQQRYSGCLLDDIVVTSTDGNKDRKLALQIKHTITFSDAKSNTEFKKVIKDCWDTFNNTFNGEVEWKFNPETDRIGIGIGVYQTIIDNHLRIILEWARTSISADEFLEKVNLKSFSSDEKVKYINIFRNVLSEAKGSKIEDIELWKFLSCLVIIHFDLEYEGSRDSIYCWNRLKSLIKNKDFEISKSIFNDFKSIVSEYARSAGSINLNELIKKIPELNNFQEQPDLLPDFQALRKHTETVLDSINDNIGNKLQLPRIEELNQLENAIKENQIIVISGEPMVGKSVLLKLLANRLRSEGEIIAFSVERFYGTTFDMFLHNIQVEKSFQDILCTAGVAPTRCILIDGLDKAIDDDKRRIIDDLIREVRNYNKHIHEEGLTNDFNWKIVFTSRNLELNNLLSNLETRKNLANKSIFTIEIESLNNAEIEEVVKNFPKLKNLASQGHLKEILSRPLILDKLTLPGISLPMKDFPERPTESWLLNWFWKSLIRLDEFKGIRGNPEEREKIVKKLAESVLSGNRELNIDKEMNSEAINGLISDRIISRTNNKITFAHDVLEEWALTILFKFHGETISEYLVEYSEPIYLTRPFQLYVLEILEIQKSPDKWIKLYTDIKENSKLSPRWYQIILTAPLFSPSINNNLKQIKPYLFNDELNILRNFLNALRKVCIKPDPMIYKNFGDLPKKELEKFVSYTMKPVKRQWLPVIQLLIQNIEKLNDKELLEFSYISEKWMRNTEGKEDIRVELAQISVKLLISCFIKFKPNSSLNMDEEDKIRDNLVISVLFAADCLPEQVNEFIIKYALRNVENDIHGFEDIFLEKGMAPIIQYLPQTYVNIATSILCKELKANKFGYISFEFDLGIKDIHSWNPPTYLKGPFIYLLRLHPQEGIDLIHKIVNHATIAWKMREEIEWGKKPLPQNIKLKEKNIEVWGDDRVFSWYRYPNTAVDSITCALMALENWMNEQIKKGTNSNELFEMILGDTKSVAMAGLCLSVAFANGNKCQEAVLPILEKPAFWFMDTYRLKEDLRSENFIRSPLLAFTGDKGSINILIESARQPHRRMHPRDYVVNLILSGPDNIRERLQTAMRLFPKNFPLFFEDEKENKQLIHERVETCDVWAAQAEPENYDYNMVDNKIEVIFKLPEEIEKRQKAGKEYITEKLELVNFVASIINILDNDNVPTSFDVKSAMEYVQNLVKNDDPSYEPKNTIEDSELVAQAIAAFAAFIIKYYWDWAKDNNYANWCKEQLIIAAERPEPPKQLNDELSMFSMGYKRSAARALPLLLLKYPNNKKIIKLIFKLASHRNNEVRAYLFNGLKELWDTNSNVVWKCITTTTKLARLKSIEYKFYYLKEKKAHNLKRTYQDYLNILKRELSLFYGKIHLKNIKNCTSEDIDHNYFESILCCLPINENIVKISSNKLLDFMYELLIFTINLQIEFKNDKESFRSPWSHSNWLNLFFRIIANLFLRIPQKQAESLIYSPIIKKWKEAPVILEEFLKQLILTGTNPEFEEKLIKLWLKIGNIVLSSDYSEIGNKGYIEDEKRDIFGLLIFIEPSGTIKWDTNEWKPLTEITDYIETWCKTVGSHPYCFPSLVKLLRNQGFYLVPKFGINWLYECISKLDNHEEFFKESKVLNSLAELLYDSWSKYKSDLKGDTQILNKYIYLVDKVAEQGDNIAIRLQSDLNDNIGK